MRKENSVNGKNLNVHYRRNAYSKKRIKFILIIAAVLVAILAVLFLIIGGALKGKVDEDKQKGENQTTPNADEVTVHTEVPSVNGYGISLSGITTSAISDKAQQISRDDGDNLVFITRDDSGKELYRSTLAENMGKQSTSQYIDVTDIGTRASNRGLTASAIVPIYSFGIKSDLERAAELFYDAAICAELYREGADDVLISLEGTDIDEDNVDELLRFSDWVKDLDSEVVLGIAITRDLLESEEAEVTVAKLWEKYDFLALDLTELQKAEDISKNGESNEVQFYLLMYKMRVLLPDVPTEELEAFVSALGAMNVDNWQTVVS